MKIVTICAVTMNTLFVLMCCVIAIANCQDSRYVFIIGYSSVFVVSSSNPRFSAFQCDHHWAEIHPAKATLYCGRDQSVQDRSDDKSNFSL